MPFTQINWCIISWALQRDISSLSDTWASSSFSFLRQIRAPDWYLVCKCKCSSVPLWAPWQGGLFQGRSLERHSWNWRRQWCWWRAPGALTGDWSEPLDLMRDRSNVNLRINQLQSTCIIYLCIRQYTMKTVKNSHAFRWRCPTCDFRELLRRCRSCCSPAERQTHHDTKISHSESEQGCQTWGPGPRVGRAETPVWPHLTALKNVKQGVND